jgi:hypothetical protein
MAYPVKIYDGKGKHLRTVDPEFNYDNLKRVRKFQAHKCGGCEESTTNKKYCSLCMRKRASKDV